LIMVKHKDAFPSIGFRPCLLRGRIVRLVIIFYLCLFSIPLEWAQAELTEVRCVSNSHSEVDTVFNQALATVSTLSDQAVAAARRGSWRPNGTFRRRFFSQAGKALRSIRTLLSNSSSAVQCTETSTAACISTKVPKDALLDAFDHIFEISFPQGLHQLRRLRTSEREKFANAVNSLPDNYVTCG